MGWIYERRNELIMSDGRRNNGGYSIKGKVGRKLKVEE